MIMFNNSSVFIAVLPPFEGPVDLSSRILNGFDNAAYIRSISCNMLINDLCGIYCAGVRYFAQMF